MPAKRKPKSAKIVLVPVQRGGAFNPFDADSYRRLARDIKSPAKINSFLKRNKVISRAGNLLGDIIPGASRLGDVAGKLGYGKRRQKGSGQRKRAIRT